MTAVRYVEVARITEKDAIRYQVACDGCDFTDDYDGLEYVVALGTAHVNVTGHAVTISRRELA